MTILIGNIYYMLDKGNGFFLVGWVILIGK